MQKCNALSAVNRRRLAEHGSGINSLMGHRRSAARPSCGTHESLGMPSPRQRPPCCSSEAQAVARGAPNDDDEDECLRLAERVKRCESAHQTEETRALARY